MPATTFYSNDCSSLKRLCLGLLFTAGLILPLFYTHSNVLLARQPDDSVKIDVYIDPTNYYYYYYSFDYLYKYLNLDGFSPQIKVLSKRGLRGAMDRVGYRGGNHDSHVYLVIVSERNLEEYQETLELLANRYQLVLWVISPQGTQFRPPPGFALDATTSASSQTALQQDFRDQVLPRLLTIYTSRFRHLYSNVRF